LSTTDIPALSLIGKLNSVSKTVTSQIALEDVAHKGFEEPVSNKGGHIKILVTPRQKQRPRTLDRRGLACNEEIKGGWPAPSGSRSS